MSNGPRLIVVIYAYGAYVDLTKSDIKMVVRPLYSAGLRVSYPTIPAHGYLQIGTRLFRKYNYLTEAVDLPNRKYPLCENDQPDSR